MRWTEALQCARCGTCGLAIDADPTGEPLPARGDAICGSCGARYPIRGHVLDMTQRRDLKFLTPAGWSNYFPLVPWIYENVWRPRSLTILTGEKFSTARELGILNDWLSLPSDGRVVDLGSSTDLYGRGLSQRNERITIFSIDLAPGMLRVGRACALREGLKNIVHVRAPAQRLPFGDATIDAVVCGGSLNEFRDLSVSLHEARRVCKPGGKMFAMSLLEADSTLGRLGQWGARAGGIQFPRFGNFNATVESAGWTRERQEICGSVAFTLMRASERR